ncbi:MAG: HAD family hydrolase [Halobacteriales archaeon]
MASEPAGDCEFEAIIYDLDGTLVRLTVDWDTVRDEVAVFFEQRGHSVEGKTLWTFLDYADETGYRDVVEEIIGEHERPGARRSDRLATADELDERTGPVGVCSLNCEAACRIALEVHELLGYVDTIVGRDSVATRKPDPEPLLTVAQRLAVDPEAILFVGDSERDEIAAERAGMAFRYVGDGPSGH